jgi:hypothetical protein
MAQQAVTVTANGGGERLPFEPKGKK